MMTKGDNVVILSDLNYPHSDWTNMCSSHRNKLSRHHKLLYTGAEPTRGVVTLYLVLSRVEDLVQDVNVVVPTGNSDHNVINSSIPVNRNLSPKYKTLTFDFKRFFIC